jgi:hypothetical protein
MCTRAGVALGLEATILAGGPGAVLAQGGWAAGPPAAWVAAWAAAWVERVACSNPPSGVVPHLFLIEYDEPVPVSALDFEGAVGTTIGVDRQGRSVAW